MWWGHIQNYQFLYISEAKKDITFCFSYGSASKIINVDLSF